MYRRILAVVAALWLASCSATFDVKAPADNDVVYSELYPYFIELCAVSQIKKKPGFGADTSGGPGGHSVLYLNGVCRERDAGYPMIALCNDDATVSAHGVGLSVNAHFKNANWVATEGHEFFFRGDLRPGEHLTREAYDRAQQKAEAMGVLDGVVFHDVVFDDAPKSFDRRAYMYEVSIATDYAVAFGRDRYCGRVPVSRAQMAQAVDYLNGVNAIYKDGKTDFVWNVLRNNCTHLAHNALAAAGIWDEWETERFVLIAAFDFPVPKNEFVNLMLRTNDVDLSDIRSLYDDAMTRNLLLSYNRLPLEPGALAEAERAIQNNDIYDTDVNLIFYDEPFLGRYEKRFHRIFNDQRYTDIVANRRYLYAAYDEARARRKPLASYLTSIAPVERQSFSQFYNAFYNRLDQEIAQLSPELAPTRPAHLGSGGRS
jgi:hypothetical protein